MDKNSNQNQLEPKEYIPVYYIYKVHSGGSHGHNLRIENEHVDNDTLHLGQSLNMHIWGTFQDHLFLIMILAVNY